MQLVIIKDTSQESSATPFMITINARPLENQPSDLPHNQHLNGLLRIDRENFQLKQVQTDSWKCKTCNWLLLKDSL